MAPEMLNINASKYTKSVDVWALGCMFYEIMYKKRLFDGVNPSIIRSNILNFNVNKFKENK